MLGTLLDRNDTSGELHTVWQRPPHDRVSSRRCGQLGPPHQRVASAAVTRRCRTVDRNLLLVANKSVASLSHTLRGVVRNRSRARSA